jgi:hypothetical protein
MYGTVMIATYNGDRAAMTAALADWQRERSGSLPGYVSSGLVFADDGMTVANFAQFANKESYLALADDPMQDHWYSTRIAPLLTGEPQWIDGEWADLPIRQSA